MTINNKFQPFYIANDSTITTIENNSSNLLFCEVNNSLNTISTVNLLNQNTNENLNLVAFDGSYINPIIKINNTHQHVNITSNLNIASNLNIQTENLNYTFKDSGLTIADLDPSEDNKNLYFQYDSGNFINRVIQERKHVFQVNQIDKLIVNRYGVGIGTNPISGHELDIDGNLYMNATSDKNNSIYLYNNEDFFIRYNNTPDYNHTEMRGYQGVMLGSTKDNGLVHLETRDDQIKILRNTSIEENLGIGTVSSSYRLDVNGDVNINGNLNLNLNLNLNNNSLYNNLYGDFFFIDETTLIDDGTGFKSTLANPITDKTVLFNGVNYELKDDAKFLSTNPTMEIIDGVPGDNGDLNRYIERDDSYVFKITHRNTESTGSLLIYPIVSNSYIAEFSFDFCLRGDSGSPTDEFYVGLFSNQNINGDPIYLSIYGDAQLIQMGGSGYDETVVPKSFSHDEFINDRLYYNIKIKINNTKVTLLFDDIVDQRFEDVVYANLLQYMNNIDNNTFYFSTPWRAAGHTGDIYIKNIKFKSGALQCQPIQDLHANSIDTPGFKYDNSTGITYLGFRNPKGIRQLRDHGTVGSAITASRHNGLTTALKICNSDYDETMGPYTKGWHIGPQYDNSSDNDNDLYFSVQYNTNDTHITGYIQDYKKSPLDNIRMNFTGQHRCVPNDDDLINNIDNYIGMVVESTGNYDSLLNINDNIKNRSIPTINESQPIVKLTTTKESKKVYGVISNKEDFKNGERTFGSTFVSVIQSLEEQKTPRLFINSLGEGGVKVCNENGNIKNGDLLCSSSIHGIAMKQDGNLIRNYTIGKATMNYNFIYSNDYKLIGCVYYCG